MANILKIPNHIAFIMDGNGRWAKKRLLPRKVGHYEGVKAMQRVINACSKSGVKAISFFAFSTENWNRPKAEVETLFSLIKKFTEEEFPKYVEDNYVVRFMGDMTKLPIDVQESIEKINNSVQGNDGMVINIGINYGGRDEIVMACRRLQNENKEISAENIDNALYTAGLLDPDVIVRSSGEKRLSNFMLWQSAYSELIFKNELWPDFDADIVSDIIKEYNGRNRRFGKVDENA